MKNFNELNPNELRIVKNEINTYNFFKENIEELNYIFIDSGVMIFKKEQCYFDPEATIINNLHCTDNVNEYFEKLNKEFKKVYIKTHPIFIDFENENAKQTNDFYKDKKLNIPRYLTDSFDSLDKVVDYYVDLYLPEKTNIQYINLNSKQFNDFILENYKIENIILSHFEFFEKKILGLYYTTLEPKFNNNENFLVGYTQNKAGKKTILGVLCYSQYNNINNIPVTYVQTIETNYYYRGQGILKKMIQEFKNVETNDIFVFTDESDMGKIAQVHKQFKLIHKDKIIIDEDTYFKK